MFLSIESKRIVISDPKTDPSKIKCEMSCNFFENISRKSSSLGAFRALWGLGALKAFCTAFVYFFQIGPSWST